MERTRLAFIVFIIAVTSNFGVVHSLCDQSKCYSLQNVLDRKARVTKEQIKEWCEVAVPYTSCLESLSSDCKTDRMLDIIDYTKQLMESYECGGSAVKVTSLLICVSLFVAFVI